MLRHLHTFNPRTAGSILSCIVDGHAAGYICNIANRSCNAIALALSIRSRSCSAASVRKAYSKECTAAKSSSDAVRFCLLFLRKRFGIFELNSGKRYKLLKGVFATSDLGFMGYIPSRFHIGSVKRKCEIETVMLRYFTSHLIHNGSIYHLAAIAITPFVK